MKLGQGWKLTEEKSDLLYCYYPLQAQGRLPPFVYSFKARSSLTRPLSHPFKGTLWFKLQLLSTFLGNCGVLMVQTLALSSISAGTAEKNGWENVWISKVTGRNRKTTPKLSL